MKRTEFEERVKVLQKGDYVKLYCRGNYGNYVAEGRIIEIERGRISLDKGKSHSYKRIIDIRLQGMR